MASIEQSLSVFSQALNLRTQRHQVLASNIANADTPNYKARDFSFETAMQNAMSGRSDVGRVDMARTSAGHIARSGAGGSADFKYRSETQSAMQYQILTQLISNKFQGIRSALASTNG